MRIRNQICTLLVISMVLGLHRGYLAIWESGSTQPHQVYPYKATLLPPEEQVRLSEGIQVENEAQLKALLMEYLS